MSNLEDALKLLADPKALSARLKEHNDAAERMEKARRDLTKARDLDKALANARRKEAEADAALASAEEEAKAIKARANAVAEKTIAALKSREDILKAKEEAVATDRREVDRMKVEARQAEEGLKARRETLEQDEAALKSKLEKFAALTA